MNRYIDEREVAKMTCRALQTLRNDRHCGRGFRYIKIGRSVRYDLEDVISFMNQHKIETEDLL